MQVAWNRCLQGSMRNAGGTIFRAKFVLANSTPLVLPIFFGYIVIYKVSDVVVNSWQNALRLLHRSG